MVFLYHCAMENAHQIFGTRTIIEDIQADAKVDKVYIQKEVSSQLMKDLMKVMKQRNINLPIFNLKNKTL